MKRFLLVILTFSMLFSCTDDTTSEDNGAADIDCELFDPAFPTLFVKFVDNMGANLIEKGTIDPDSLRVPGDFANARFYFVPANVYAVQDADIRKFDNTIQLVIPQQSTFQYLIYFGHSDSVLVDVSAKLTRIPCDISYFMPTAVTFKDVDVNLSEESAMQFLAELEL